MVLRRLGAIIGYCGQKNEVIFSTEINDKIKEITCYFGGDVQNYPEIMTSHRDHGKFLQWNLLATASLLSAKFPLSAVLVILPSSCYDNFVPTSNTGTPSHTPMSNAIEHLKHIIEKSIETWKSDCLDGSDVIETNSTKTNFPHLDSVEVINLVGFSKGCVVLNQLIREYNTISSSFPDSDLLRFWKKIKNIYWLDGAHSGGNDTWVVDQSVLKSLATCDLQVHVHVTPYQIEDERRPWIRKECKAFVSGLRRAGSQLSYQVHFDELPPSIEMHFKIIESFKLIGN